jgi:hypothetical protein
MQRVNQSQVAIVVAATVALGACSADLVPLPRSGNATSTIDYCIDGGVGVSVKNAGNRNAGPSAVTLQFGVGGPIEVSTPAIDAGKTVDLAPVPIPAGCFTPDCGVKITVDSHGQVAEGNEKNNEGTGICVG